MRAFDGIITALTMIIVALVVLMGYMVYLTVQEHRACEAKGGEIVGTGTYHTESVLVGKIIVPQQVENTKCTKE